MSTVRRAAVVTGGHGYDVQGFTEMFRAFEGFRPYLMTVDDLGYEYSQDRLPTYDVFVFYNFQRVGPDDEAGKWWQGRPGSAVQWIVDHGKGVVILHHALLAYPQWSLWHELVGISDRRFSAKMDQEFLVQVSRTPHPITEDLADWLHRDESYKMLEPDSSSTTLLTVDHPLSMRSVAWTRTAGQSKVFCFQLGHDHEAWTHPSFAQVLRRGMSWVDDSTPSEPQMEPPDGAPESAGSR